MTSKASAKKATRKTCCKCEKEQPISNFYNTSYSNIFVDNKIPICKDCVFKNIEEHGFEEFQNLMKLINKPIFSDMFDGNHGDYIRKVASLPQYRSNSYEDTTLFDERKAISNTKKIKASSLSEEELNELIDFFGEGYEEKDYIYLSSEYEDFLNRYEVDSKTLENLIKEICLTQLDIRKKRAQGDKVDAQQKTLQDLLGSSNLKPVQENASSGVAEAETFGTLIRKFENEHPIPEPHDSWKDVDGIGRYVRTFFLGHMARMFGKENPYEEEYNEIIGEYTVKPPSKEED